MRVTNGMIINTSLSGLYNNMNAMNKTYAQMTTGKKIQTVSDDPIIAGRALKLKTTVLENTQYQSNTKEANSWMEVTEVALDNMTKILDEIRTKCVQGATGTLEKKDKESIKTEIAQRWKQLQDEANVTYGGRYVFSGYKTNESLVLTKDLEIKGKDITFAGDISIGGKSTIASGSELADGTTIAKGSTLGKDTTINAGSEIGAGTIFSKEDINGMLDGTGFKLEDGKYTYDADYTISAETTISIDAQAALDPSNSSDKFVANRDDSGAIVSYTLKEDFTIPANTQLENKISEEVSGLTFDGISYTTTKTHTTAKDYTLTKELSIGGTSTLKGTTTVKGDTTIAQNSIIKEGSICKVGTTLGKGSLNPEVIGKIDGHAIEYEIGVNSTITVNTEEMDSIFIKMAECFNEMFSKIDESLEDDTITVTDLHNMFNKKLDEIDKILENVSEVTSDLGSRMSRVEYVDSRLTDQKLTFKDLLSETEDIDIEEVYTNFNVQYATYQSALQATAKIITNTLADYL